ncbi:MAG: prephenate dehydratase [Candidatus Omnitrophica bacterium]|nr:prephenate dehydratase [Candidatus Omnitrophota bacterium]
MSKSDLQRLRKKIDALDLRLVELLNKRTSLAVAIGKVKARAQAPVFTPAREAEVFRNIAACNKGPLSAQALRAIYTEIMSATRVLQKPLRVAYLGPKATFTHQASLKKFGQQAEYAGQDTITDIFSTVERGTCDYGVVPVENSIEGAVNHTLDMFVDSDLKICAEIMLEISQHLLSRVSRASIRRVYSKAEVFGQCRLWLESNLPGRELVETSSTSRAAEIAAAEKNAAAIAGSLAALLYGVPVLAESIQDIPHNRTRFLVIGKTAAGRTGRDKTSVIFSAKDRAGALHDMLAPFKKDRINLTKIESRPSKKKAWQYYFFVDMEGHATEPRVKRALADLEHACSFFKVIGAYPQSPAEGGENV